MKRNLLLVTVVVVLPALLAAVFLSYYFNIAEPPSSETSSELVWDSSVTKISREDDREGERVWSTQSANESMEDKFMSVQEEGPLGLEKEFVDLLASGDEQLKEVAFQEVLPRLVQEDVATALWLIEEADPGPLREELLRQVSLAWAEFDPYSALEWAFGLPDEGEDEKAMARIIMAMAQTSGKEAMEALERYGLDENSSLLGNLIQVWSEQDMPEALDWLERRPSGDERDVAVVHIAFIQSRTSPAEAAQLVVSEMPPSTTRDEAVMTVVHQWGLRDLSAATAWVEGFPDDELRERAIDELAGISLYHELLQDEKAKSF